MRVVKSSLLISFLSAFLNLFAQDDLGKQVYSTVCIACHQPTGAGLPPVFPTLINTEYVNGSSERMAAIVLKGVMGPNTVNGSAYNNIMP